MNDFLGSPDGPDDIPLVTSEPSYSITFSSSAQFLPELASAIGSEWLATEPNGGLDPGWQDWLNRYMQRTVNRPSISETSIDLQPDFRLNPIQTQLISKVIGPVSADEYLLWPDPVADRVHYAPRNPHISEFFLLAVEGPDLTIHEGRVVMVLAVSELEAEPDVLQARKTRLIGKMKELGYEDSETWRFLPLIPTRLTASLTLPPGLQSGDVAVETSPAQGFVTIMFGLTSTGAHSWYTALEAGEPQALQGSCNLVMDFSAIDGATLSIAQHGYSSSLGTLARDAELGSTNIRKERPPITNTLNPNIIVGRGNEIEYVRVDLNPSFAPTTSHSFDFHGGIAQITVPENQFDDFEVAWMAQVAYKMPFWPNVEVSGKLTPDRMGEIIKPSSWIRAIQLMVALQDESGRVIPVGKASDPNNYVTGAVTIEAPFWDSPYSLDRAFATSDQQLMGISFPLPEGESPEDVMITLTVQAVRDGVLKIETKTIPFSNPWIVVSVTSSGQIYFDTPGR